MITELAFTTCDGERIAIRYCSANTCIECVNLVTTEQIAFQFITNDHSDLTLSLATEHKYSYTAKLLKKYVYWRGVQSVSVAHSFKAVSNNFSIFAELSDRIEKAAKRTKWSHVSHHWTSVNKLDDYIIDSFKQLFS